MLLYFILFVPLFVLILLGVHMLVATSNPDPAKIAPYECGFSSFSDARQKFQISFFLVAILFLVFDSEILFLYPLAISLYHVSFLGFWIALFFIFIITIGFIYELASNVLDYAKTPSSKNTPLVVSSLPGYGTILPLLMTSLSHPLMESVSVTKGILSLPESIKLSSALLLSKPNS